MKRLFEIYVLDNRKEEDKEIFGGSLEEVIESAKNIIEERNKRTIFKQIHFKNFYLISRSYDKYIRLSTENEGSYERQLIINELSIEQFLDIISKEVGELETLKEETTKQILEKESKIDKLKEFLI